MHSSINIILLDIVFTSWCYLCIFTVGNIIARQISKNTKVFLLSASIGVAFLSVIINIFYAFGWQLNNFFWVLFICLSALLLFQIYRFIQNRRYYNFLSPTVIYGCIIFVAANLLLLTPKWMGGESFAVFQGNSQDQFSYLITATVYFKHTINDILAFQTADVLNN